MEELSKQYISAVDKLQTICVKTYLRILTDLREGMSEKDIVNAITALLEKKGVMHFWYDIGVMVLVGERRFRDMTLKDYTRKSPSSAVLLNCGNPIFIDMHPMDNDGIWADYSSMAIFKPQNNDQEKVSFLHAVYDIHMRGIRKLNPHMTGSQVYSWYKEEYKKENIQLDDPRNNVGHSMSFGEKQYEDGRDKRIFLDENNNEEIGGLVLAIEPGGHRKNEDGSIFVGRFEDCVYIPRMGKPKILGRKFSLPLFIS